MPNLTKKFSRDSMRRATRMAQLSKSKMKSIEAEIAAAAAAQQQDRKHNELIRKTYSGKLSKSLSTVSESSGVSNMHLLPAMSSLTEDRFNAVGEVPEKLDYSSRVIGPSESFANSISRPVLSSLSQDPTPETVPTTSRSYSLAGHRSSSKASMATQSHESREPADSRRPSLSSCRDSSTPQLSGYSLDLAAHQSPIRSSFSYGQRTTISNRTSASFRRRRVGATLRSVNNPSSPAIKDKESDMENTERGTPTPPVHQAKTQRKVGFLSSVAACFEVLLDILLLPKTLLLYLFRGSDWSAKDRSILITGASSGIGAELARQYAVEGAKLALVARTQEDLIRVAKECRELGASNVQFYTADLTNLTSIQTALKLAVSEFRKFEVVILNAGRCQGCYFEEIKDARQIEQLLKLNATGSITTLHYLLPYMPKTRDSRIVVVSHTAGIVATPYQSIYSASKHALTGFTNSLRMELNNTYRQEAPKVCLVSFPEVSGTKINLSRMDMGARLPAARWYSWAGIPLPLAVRNLLHAIAAGKREHGQKTKFKTWRLLYPICPSWVDSWMLKYVQSTHYRPRQTTADRSRTKPAGTMEARPKNMSTNKSWTG